MKKLIALLLALVMVFSLAACGAGSAEQKAPESQHVVGEKEDSAQKELENKENIDNTVVRESVAIAYQSVTSLAPWGTNNNVPGNYEAYEMLYPRMNCGVTLSRGDAAPFRRDFLHRNEA